MEALDNYYHAKIHINNKRSIIDEVIYAFECFVTKKVTFKQLYLLLLLSTCVVYFAYSCVYIIFGLYLVVALDIVYLLIAGFIISLYFNKNFYIICTLYVYIGSHICMAILLYIFGFASGMWFFIIMMIYFSSVVTLENFKTSKLLFLVQLANLIILYLLDVFVWAPNREINEELLHILYIFAFVGAISIYVALSVLCNIDGISSFEKARAEINDMLNQTTKSRYDLVYKKYFINTLSILLNNHSKESQNTHFILLDLSYKAKYKNSLSKENINLRVDLTITQAIKTYFPNTTFISHWNKNQFMFILFDKEDDHVFMIMQIFIRECKKRLQNLSFDEIYQTNCTCACAKFGNFAKINLKQAIYETENLLQLSKNYGNDSIFVANYTKKEED